MVKIMTPAQNYPKVEFQTKQKNEAYPQHQLAFGFSPVCSNASCHLIQHRCTLKYNTFTKQRWSSDKV